MARPGKKVVIERHVYRHSVNRGIVARRIKYKDGEKIADRSCYFSYRKHGGKAEAIRRAIYWKRRNLRGSFWT